MEFYTIQLSHKWRKNGCQFRPVPCHICASLSLISAMKKRPFGFYHSGLFSWKYFLIRQFVVFTIWSYFMFWNQRLRCFQFPFCRSYAGFLTASHLYGQLFSSSSWQWEISDGKMYSILIQNYSSLPKQVRDIPHLTNFSFPVPGLQAAYHRTGTCAEQMSDAWQQANSRSVDYQYSVVWME